MKENLKNAGRPSDDDAIGDLSLEEAYNVFYHRIENILAVAAANDVEILVLGAFGCGAFNNPPELVADVFSDLLSNSPYRHNLKKAVFAIKTGGRMGMKNYSVFSECFSEWRR